MPSSRCPAQSELNGIFSGFFGLTMLVCAFFKPSTDLFLYMIVSDFEFEFPVLFLWLGFFFPSLFVVLFCLCFFFFNFTLFYFTTIRCLFVF